MNNENEHSGHIGAAGVNFNSLPGCVNPSSSKCDVVNISSGDESDNATRDFGGSCNRNHKTDPVDAAFVAEKAEFQYDQCSGTSSVAPNVSALQVDSLLGPTRWRQAPAEDEMAYYPSFMGCRSVDEFERMNRIEEGMYGVVFRAKDLRTQETVALKRLKMEREREGFPITSLREISCLLKANHENVVHVREVVVGNSMDKIYIVMEYVEHDLKSLMEMMPQPFSLGEAKTLLIQLARGIQHLHDHWIVHRDIKTSNLLLNHKGILKIGDFGLAREYGSPLKSYTPIVVTLWYRAPELLLGINEYSTPIDIWSMGCVFAEIISKKPLFPGKSEIDQINRIFQELGTPNDVIWPGPPPFSKLPFSSKINFKQYSHNRLKSRFSMRLTESGLRLLNRFLTYDPVARVSAEEALKHDFFTESPLPVPPALFPTWPTKHERDVHFKKKENPSPVAPQGGGGDEKSQEKSSPPPGLFQLPYTGGFTMSSEGKGKVTGAVETFTLRF